MLETALVVLAHGIVVAQQLVAAQHQLAKIDHAFALALLFVQRIEFNLFTGVRVFGVHIARALAVFFAAGDEPHQLLGWVALVVHIELFAQPLDGAELVLHIQNLEALWQIRQLVVGAQQPVAQAVEGADPHATHVDGQHAGQPRHHLFGGFVGKRDRHHTAGGDLTRLQQPSDAGGQYPRFARARARQNQGVALRQGDGRQLLRIQVI